MPPVDAAHLQPLTDAVQEFIVAFERWLKTQRFSDRAGTSRPSAVLREGFDLADAEQLAAVVDRAAERAHLAGLLIPQPSLFGMDGTNVFAQWRSVCQPRSPLSPDRVVANATVALRRLERAAQRAQDGLAPFPVVDPTALDPVVWESAANPWFQRTPERVLSTVALDVWYEVAKRLQYPNWATSPKAGEGAVQLARGLLTPGDPEPNRPKLIPPGVVDLQAMTQLGGFSAVAVGMTEMSFDPSVNNSTATEDLGAWLHTWGIVRKTLLRCEVRAA